MATPTDTRSVLTLDRRPIDWRGLRTAIGMTQKEFADLLTIGVNTVRRYEAGSSRPRQSHITLLRVALSMPELMERRRAARFPHPFPEDDV